MPLSRGALASVAAAAIAALGLLIIVLRLGAVGLAVPVGVAGALLLVRRPGVCLGLYVGMLIVFEQRAGPLIPGDWVYKTHAAGISVATAVLALLLVAVLGEAARRHRGVALHPVILAGITVLVLAIVAGCITASSAGVGFSKLYDTILALAPLVAVPFAVHLTLDSRRRIAVAAWVTAGLVATKAVIGLAAVLGGFSTGAQQITVGPATRLTYYEPTVNWLSLVMLLVGVSAVLRRVDLPRWVQFAMPIVTLSLLLSYRRSFWIATVLGLLIVVLFGASRLQRRLVVPAAVLLAGALWVTFTIGGAREALAGPVGDRAASLDPSRIVNSRDDRYRIDERANVIAAIRAHAVSGLGPGVPWTAEVPLPLDNPNGREYVHFALLWFWLKLGVLGAVAYVTLFAGGVVAAVRASRRQNDPVLACVGLALVGGFFGLALAETTADFVGADVRLTAMFGAALGLASRLSVTPR